MEKISIQTEARGTATVVTVSGRIDSETASKLDAELTSAVGGSANLVLEMQGVDYMSSAGIRAIVKAAQAAEKKGGPVKMASAPELVTSIFYTVGIVDKIKSYATVDEAIASF
ncbi:MAG: STAS domain-containing protein [Chloroflexi bacterium]|nr:STAS domain-containing protein [Chloroflexota bacterium]